MKDPSLLEQRAFFGEQWIEAEQKFSAFTPAMSNYIAQASDLRTVDMAAARIIDVVYDITARANCIELDSY